MKLAELRALRTMRRDSRAYRVLELLSRADATLAQLGVEIGKPANYVGGLLVYLVRRGAVIGLGKSHRRGRLYALTAWGRELLTQEPQPRAYERKREIPRVNTPRAVTSAARMAFDEYHAAHVERQRRMGLDAHAIHPEGECVACGLTREEAAA